MPLRLLYAVAILWFIVVHGIAIQKLNALAPEAPATSLDRASGD